MLDIKVKLGMSLVIDWFLVARARYRPTFPFDGYSYRWHYFVLAVSGKTLFIKA